MFHGLRVRMGGHTARVTHLTTDPVSSQLQYRGELLQTARAVSDACAGGQIVFTQATISAVYSMTHLTSSKYGDVVLLHEGRHYLTPPPMEELATTPVQRTGGSSGTRLPGAARDSPPAPGHFQRMLAEELAEEEERRAARDAGEAERHTPGGAAAGAQDGSSVMWLSGYSGPVGEGVGGMSGESAWSVLASSDADEGGVSVHVHGLHAYERLDMSESAGATEQGDVAVGAIDAHEGVGPVAEGMAGDDSKELGLVRVWAQQGPAYDQLGQVSPERPVPAPGGRGNEGRERPRGQSLSFEFPMGTHLVTGATEDTASLVQTPSDLSPGAAVQRLDAGALRAAAAAAAAAATVAPVPAPAGGLRSSGASSSLASQVPGRGSWGSLAGTDTGTPSAVPPQRPISFHGATSKGQNIFQEIRGIRDRYLRAQLQNHRPGPGPAPELTMSEDYLQRVRTSPPLKPTYMACGPMLRSCPSPIGIMLVSYIYIHVETPQPG